MSFFEFTLLIFYLLTFCSAEQAQSIKYDPELANRMMLYSKISYCESPDIISMTCIPCHAEPNLVDLSVFTSKKHQAQAFTAIDKVYGQIVVAFRGTMTNLNWLLDFYML